MANADKEWDVFISHASEDKNSFVRPLATALRSLGASVWYDEFSLRLGDSLSRSIDRGLGLSRYGLVIISSHFLQKPWPEYELRGLVARELGEDRVILPVWYGVTREEVLKFSPPLADKFALDTKDLPAQDIAIQLLREIRPELYAQHPRSELEQIASGEAIQELQTLLETAHEELAAYRCPYCQSEVTERIHAPADLLEKHWDVRESFACGFQSFGGSVERPCPANPRFPKFEDYELFFDHNPGESHWKWSCDAVGKTEMARRVHLRTALGETKEEAEEHLREHYHQLAVSVVA